MSRVLLDPTTSRAVRDAGSLVEVCDSDGKPLGLLVSEEFVEALVRRAHQPLPPGFATKEEFYQEVRRRFPPKPYDPATPMPGIPHDEAMRRWGLA